MENLKQRISESAMKYLILLLMTFPVFALPCYDSYMRLTWGGYTKLHDNKEVCFSIIIENGRDVSFCGPDTNKLHLGNDVVLPPFKQVTVTLTRRFLSDSTNYVEALPVTFNYQPLCVGDPINFLGVCK